MVNPLLSVIIPTLNEEENLCRCVKSLAEQTCRDFEVIVADGGSTDQTVEIATKNSFRVLPVGKTRPHDVSTAKNLGAKHSRDAILVFLDADMILDPNCSRCLRRGTRTQRSSA